jgi:hypothetical protein
MAGINDRVQAFLKSWPIVKEQLNRLLEEENGKEILEREGTERIYRRSAADNLQQDQPGQIPYSMQKVNGKGKVGKKRGGYFS